MAKKKTVKLANMYDAINEAIEAYGKAALESVADSIEKGANLFMVEAKKVSPTDAENGKSAHYRDCWAIAPTQYAKYKRYVGNTKKVKGKNGSQIPLINILEFSTTRGHPHVNNAIRNSKDRIFDIVKSNLEKVGK